MSCFTIELIKYFIYLFLEKGGGKERGRRILMCKRDSDQLPLACPELGTWPTTQACTLTSNGTSDYLLCGLTLNQLSHADQGYHRMNSMKGFVLKES